MMQYKIYLTLTVLIIFLSSCNLSTKKTETKHTKTVVCGEVVNQTPETSKVITVISCEPLAKKERYATRIDSTGKFRAEFEMLWGHSFTINYDKKFINAYADSGDSIYIEIDATKLHDNNHDAIQFSGNNSTKNREFNHAFTDLAKIVNYNAFEDFTLPIEEFMHEFENEVKKMNDSIAIYCKKNNISKWAENMVQDMSLYALSNYVSSYEGQSRKDQLSFFTQPIFDIYNPKKFKNMMFSYHLGAYFHRLILQDTVIANFHKAQNFSEAEKHALRKLLETPKCLSRDYMIALLYSKIKEVENNIDSTLFSNKNVYNKILELKKPEKALNLPKIKSGKGAFFITSEGKIENIEDFNFEKLINEKYKGKVVYIDVWAAWCGPCRAEMAPAHELHRLFEGKDVAFVNICMVSSQKAWIKAIKTENITGDNYYFDSDLSAEASAKMLSGGYPTYILIDKNGKIRNRKAPRPSNLSKAGDAIDKLLLEK